MKKKLTQKKTAFYLLWKGHQENPEAYLPAWRFVGEIHLKEIGQWFFMSYKGPTNGLAIFFDEPDVVERRMTTGKTGAQYYEYRIRPDATPAMVRDEDLRELVELLDADAKGEILEV